MAAEEAVDNAVDVIHGELKEGLGDRCERFEAGCLTCQSWQAFDTLSSALYLIWQAKKDTP